MRFPSRFTDILPKRHRPKLNKSKESRIKGLYIPLASLVVALITVVGSLYAQYRANKLQAQLKEYELSFKPKQEGYAEFMRLLLELFDTAATHHPDPRKITSDVAHLHNSYFSLEPFLNSEERIDIWNKLQEYASACYDLYKAPITMTDVDRAKASDMYLTYQHYFREHLFNALFTNTVTY